MTEQEVLRSKAQEIVTVMKTGEEPKLSHLIEAAVWLCETNDEYLFFITALREFIARPSGRDQE